jgi:hypothetical protein
LTPIIDRVALSRDDGAHDRQVHRDARERRDVARARHVAWRVEPVRPHEVRVVQAELRSLLVHPADEAGDVAAGRRCSERVGGVVGALDERAFEQVVHRDALSGGERDPRLADLRGALRHRHDVARPQVLQRDEHRHQLRDARDRDARLRVVRGEHVAVRGVHDVPRAGVVQLRRRGVRTRGERERSGAT